MFLNHARYGNRQNLFSFKPRTILAILMTTFLIQNTTAQIIAGKGTALDDKTKSAAIDSISAALNSVYVFPDVAVKMGKLLHKNLKDGKYKPISDLQEFAMRLTEDLRSVSHDKHLSIRPIPPRDINQPVLSPEQRKQRQLDEKRRDNFGFREVSILPGNIGYLKFDYFADAASGGGTAIAAMNFLAYTDAIIIDLRENGGGNPSMIQLLSSYFFDEPVHLNSFYIRKGDSTQQFWTQGWVQGTKMINTPIYILTSSNTFSGAEEFTYNMKNLKRATILGETTGGGAHPVEFREFTSLGLGMSLPFGRAVNPITGTNWEGTGIEPHLKMPADLALSEAKIEAIKFLMTKSNDEARVKQLNWFLNGIESERNPVTLSPDDLQKFTGSYGPRRIFMEDGNLTYQREGRPKFKMIPMSSDQFMIKGLDNFRIKFKMDETGKVTELIGLYDNGETDINPRTE